MFVQDDQDGRCAGHIQGLLRTPGADFTTHNLDVIISRTDEQADKEGGNEVPPSTGERKDIDCHYGYVIKVIESIGEEGYGLDIA